ncbi:MAG: carbohydrate ABC transporter substrate-binding protein [Clostridia bacterium]|nr:carbohydrate ABC transporter substrate-binding protein [Clostridia bacterium]
MKKTLALLLAVIMTAALISVAAAEEPVTIRFSWWGDALRHEATLKAIAMFEEANPNIHVEAEYGGWDGYTDKLTTQIMGGTAADVVQDGGHFMTYIIYGASYTDLKDYLDIIDTSNFSQSLLDSYCSVDGKLISMPTGVQAWTTLQNTSLLKDNGIEPPARWTWDGLVEAGRKLHEADPEAYMLNVSMETMTNWLFPMFIQQKVGGTVINDNYAMEFTADDLTAYLTWLENMWAANALQGRSEQLLYDGSPLENPKWNGGKLAISMCSSASYSWYVFDDYLKEHIDVVECFSFPEGEADNDSIIVPPASFYNIPAASEHKKEAAMLIDFLLNNLDAGRVQGTVRSLPANSAVLAVLQAEDLVDPGIARAVELGSPRACVKRGTPTGLNEVQDVLSVYIEQIAYGKITAAEAGPLCYEEIAEALQDVQ